MSGGICGYWTVRVALPARGRSLCRPLELARAQGHKGRNKETKARATVWILRKDALPKELRDEKFYETVRKSGAGRCVSRCVAVDSTHSCACRGAAAAALSRLRHPYILSLQHPLDESRNAFVMVGPLPPSCVADCVVPTAGRRTDHAPAALLACQRDEGLSGDRRSPAYA
jgi:hypothetical protein